MTMERKVEHQGTRRGLGWVFVLTILLCPAIARGAVQECWGDDQGRRGESDFTEGFDLDEYEAQSARLGHDGRGPGGGLVEAVGGTGTDVFYDAVETSDGGVVAVGYTTSLGAGGKDVLLVKFDTCGDFVWRKTLGGSGDEEARAVIEVTDDDLVITGLTTTIGDPGDGMLIARFNSDGDEIWTKVDTDPAGIGDYYELRGYDVIEDSDGHFVVTGEVWTTNTQFYSVLIVGVDSNGNRLVHGGFRRPGSPSWDYWGEALIEACSGDYVIVGGAYQYRLAQPDLYCILITRIAHDITFGWARLVQCSEDISLAHDVTEAEDGNLVLTGKMGDYLFLSKWDCTGTIPIWQKRLQNGSEGHSVTQATGGHGLVVTGAYADDSRVFVGSWASDGSASWLQAWGDGIGRSVAEDTDERLWIAGETSWGAGGQDGLVAKLDADGDSCLPSSVVPLPPVNWNPADEDQVLTWHGLPPVEWRDWDVDTVPVEPQQYFVCDDECEEACCADDGSCNHLTPDDCKASSPPGEFQGPGTTCDSTGACCLRDASCIITTEACCEHALVEGSYQNDGTTCSPTGACCLSDGSCVITTQACCEDALVGGTYQGNDTGCDLNSCPGACCVPDGTCTVRGKRDCEVQPYGDYRGYGTSCPPDPPCPVCGNGTVEYPEECDPPDGGLCDENCKLQGAIPTVSQWGMVVMTLIMVTVATLVLRWRAALVRG